MFYAKYLILEGSSEHFYKWCDSKSYGNYGNKDPKGKSRGSYQVWFKEYREPPGGEGVSFSW